MISRKSLSFVVSQVSLAFVVFLGACGEPKSQNSETSASGSTGGSCPHSLSADSSQINIDFPGGLNFDGGQFKYCNFELNPGAGATILSTTIMGSANLNGSGSILLRREFRSVGGAGASPAMSTLTSSGSFSVNLGGSYSVSSETLAAKFIFDTGRAKSSNLRIDRISIQLK